MPTYDYRCKGCEDLFEVNRPIGVRGPASCPTCGNEAKRVFTPVGVAFKGGGFHNTDYRTPPAEKSEGACPSKNDSSPACASCPATD